MLFRYPPFFSNIVCQTMLLIVSAFFSLQEFFMYKKTKHSFHKSYFLGFTYFFICTILNIILTKIRYISKSIDSFIIGISMVISGLIATYFFIHAIIYQWHFKHRI